MNIGESVPSQGPMQVLTKTASTRLSVSERSNSAIMGDPLLHGLSNRIGIPNGKSLRGPSQSSRTYSQYSMSHHSLSQNHSHASQNDLSVLALSANSIDWGDSSDQFVAATNGRGRLSNSARKRSSSLDNLPETSAVTEFEEGRIQQRKSAPDLIGQGVNLYDSVMMDLFAEAGINVNGAHSRSNESLGSGPQHSHNSLSKSTGNDFNQALPFNSTRKIQSSRSSDNLIVKELRSVCIYLHLKHHFHFNLFYRRNY